MDESIFKSLFPKFETFETTKKKKFTQDLFTKKLGHKVSFSFNTISKKNNSILRKPFFFKNISTFPKNNSNSDLSTPFYKEKSMSKLSFTRNKQVFSQGDAIQENNKLMSFPNFNSSFKQFNAKNKKDVKKWLENNINSDNKNNTNDITITQTNEKIIENKPKIILGSATSSFKKNFISSNININNTDKNRNTNNIKKKNKAKEENTKDNTENKTSDKKNIKNKSNIKEIKILKKENKSKILIKSFYENFIDIYNIYESYIEYKTSINKFNETYFYLFEIKSFPDKFDINMKFLETYKYSCIIIICLIFISKDENLYKENTLKMKELLQEFIYLCINEIEYKILESSKINFFVEKIKTMNKSNNMSLIDKTNEVINLLFLEKMNEYKKIRKCLKQLANNIDKLNAKQIFSLINYSILFCHNYEYLEDETDEEEEKERGEKGKKEDKETENIKTETSIKTEIQNTNPNDNNNDNIKITVNNSKNDIESINIDQNNNIGNKNKENNSINNTQIEVPYIKSKMTKKFCLVLDLDETLIHNMNLSFGEYFFVRPGFFDLIKSIKDIYEIIIFTEKEKKNVDDIINKIDYNNYIDYVLYKRHVIYEEEKLIKKLELIGRSLNKIIYVDNTDISSKYNKNNLYKVSSWYNNIFDDELILLKEKLINISKSGTFDEDITKGINS